MTKPLLKVRGLTKTYPNGAQALSGVDLEVQEGEFLVVIGLSGSGKSTLLRCISGLTEPTNGEIQFAGHRRQIAMIFQNFNLINRFSALKNVLMGRLSFTNLWTSLIGFFSVEDRNLAEKYLKLVGLGDRLSIRADALSGGQQQRVAIARALAQEPKLLLADEPVASLDPATCHIIMDYLRVANRDLGITIICNLHFLSLVREYATRVIALRDGKIVFTGSPSEIDQAWFKKIYGESARDIYVQ